MIIRGAAELDRRFDLLSANDIFVGPLPAKYLRGALAVDLQARGLRCVPSLLCQILSRSKCAQAMVLRRWMAPHTRVVARRADLMEALRDCARQGINAVVTKQEGMHCGHGIRRWDNVEILYNTVAFCESAYPFVLQPFLDGITDVRVIAVGEYVEAYARQNPDNFRANLAAGGASRPFNLGPAMLEICRAVMDRGRFPCGHIDLQITPDGACFLSEIALEGGITGARISREELNRRKREVIESLAAV